MCEFLAFASEHWIVVILMIVLVGDLFWISLKKILRTINIVCRGWPPSHLNCDGDFKNRY